MASASVQAYEIIREEIISGRFPPGHRLIESDLTALCNVSRTPVREALRRLVNEGLAEFSPNYGAQVADPGDEDLEALYELRTLIEGYGAARAATRISEAEIAELEALAGQMEALVRKGADHTPEAAGANSRFHRIILEAARSARLLSVAGLVVETPLVLRTLARYSADERERSMRHHRELIAAFRARDGRWAEAVMTGHIKAAFAAIRRDLAQRSPGDRAGQR
ncbi:GntR family transcriptional regulator [Hyphomonas sp. NPDC076900]|uniref:GntR family transcriptional regulator n=1 Tax=unclassified Hyphomonas TaxID=2630699 RepID=UPI003D011879